MNINEKTIPLMISNPLNYCIIDGGIYPLADIEGMGHHEFAMRTQKAMPDKLYKFFPNSWITEREHKKPVNYSHQALINNTVYMQSPELFDDIYDSDIHIDWQEYSNMRLRIYCRNCNCDVDESSTYEDMLYKISIAFFDTIEAKKDFKSAFINLPHNKREKQQHEIFSLYVENELLNQVKREIDSKLEWQNAVHNALSKEYSEYMKNLRQTFRTSCFTTSPYSQLMWGGAYADSHKGFCVEYRVDKTDEKYSDLLYNLYPVIYCKSRPNITERLVKMWDNEFTSDKMWDIYFHGALRKSIEWVQQNEWRLLLPLGKDSKNYVMPFFPISKVYIGNRMDKKDKADIIEICHNKNIPYIGVRRSDDIFEMKDCNILCENCPYYL